jgi:adenylate cyclase class 2
MEIEVKFRIGSPEEMAARLKKLGAKLIESGLEINMKFGRKDVRDEYEKLKLRLRSFGGDVSITHKEKPKNNPKGFKVRDEAEIRADSFENSKKLLDRLGLVPKWTYEKKKQVWVLDGVEVLINVIPVLGNFLEIEASPELIRKTAKRIGFDMKDAVTESYGDMYGKYRKEHSLPREDLRFPEDEK